MSESTNPLDAFLEKNGESINNEQPTTGKHDLSPNWLDMSVNYPMPRYLFSYNGVGFSPLGGIQAIAGHKKNGKSFLAVQLMAAALGSTKLGGLKLNTGEGIPKEPVVLYIDTEMEIENTSLEAKRVHVLSGFDLKTNHPRFHSLWLREESKTIRYEKTIQAIEELKPTLVVIDGIRDLTTDINDAGESSDLIDKLMKTSSRLNCCIWNCLHYNDGSEKMRGWLGTELGNKCTDVLEVVKNKKDGIVNFSVNQKDNRGKDFDNWTFYVDDTIYKFGIPVITGSDDYVEEDDMKRASEYLEGFMEINGSALTYTTIWKEMYHQARERGHKVSMESIKELASLCKICGILIPVKGGLRYVGLNAPKSAQSELPFPRSDEGDSGG